MGSKSVFLDVDSSICEKNYLVANDPEEEDFTKLFGKPGPNQLPPKLVKPTPGFCIKTKDLHTDKKIFVNVCHTDAIPPPKDITEAELREIMDTDEVCDFRIPMSIGDLHTESDNKGDSSTVCDIAIHPAFFQKVKNSLAFKEFFVAVAFEGLKEKYKLETKEEKIILLHKKAIGSLQVHRIQQRDIDEKMGVKERLPSVDDMLGKNEPGRKIIEVISDKGPDAPKFRLFIKPDDDDHLYAEVYLPYITSSRDLSLDVGEDRIVVESTGGTYFLDIFHEYLIDQEKTNCVFNKDTKFLTLTMPIKAR